MRTVVRWGQSASHVYVVQTADGYECVACSRPGFRSRTAEVFLQHLERHIQDGQHVPHWVGERIDPSPLPAEDSMELPRPRRTVSGGRGRG